MQPAPASNPFSNPSQMSLLILGIVLLVIGIFFWPLLILGVLLIVFGLVYPNMMGGGAPGGYYPQPYYQQPYAPAPAQPAQPAPQPVAPPMTAPVASPATPSCPRCGRPVTWIAQYQRWYCSAENMYPWG